MKNVIFSFIVLCLILSGCSMFKGSDSGQGSQGSQSSQSSQSGQDSQSSQGSQGSENGGAGSQGGESSQSSQGGDGGQSSQSEEGGYTENIGLDDIESAMAIARSYYGDSEYSLESIELESDKIYYEDYAEDYEKGNIIAFETYVKEKEDEPRVIILAREDTQSVWTVINEGA